MNFTFTTVKDLFSNFQNRIKKLAIRNGGNGMTFEKWWKQHSTISSPSAEESIAKKAWNAALDEVLEIHKQIEKDSIRTLPHTRRIKEINFHTHLNSKINSLKA